MPPRLICFDAGFTLIRPKQTMEERLAEVLLSHGHTARSEDVRQAWEAADAWFWDEYHRSGNTTWTSDERIEETWRSYHHQMLRGLGLSDAAHELVEAVLDGQFASDAWELYPDTLGALRRVHGMDGGHLTEGPSAERRPQVAIVSDWGSNLTEIVRSLDLDPWIDFVLASGAVNLAKPSPEFFLLACERAGVRPAAAVMIGDSHRADVLGARSAGMSAVLLDREGVAGDLDPDLPVARDLVTAVEIAFRQDDAEFARNEPDAGTSN